MTNHKDQIGTVRPIRRLCLASTSGAAAMLLTACSQMSMPAMPPLPDFPENTSDFRPRVYAGAAVGSSSLKPATDDTVFDVASDSDTGSQMRIGYDLHNLLAVELDTSVLGSAQLAQGGIDVKYSAIGASALLYAGGDAASRSRREGWSAYGRLGYAYVKRASQVIPLDESGAVPVVGIGAEYGMPSGLGIRAELTRLDDDATYAGIGAVYRFGLSAREFGSVFVDAARPVLPGGDDDLDDMDAVNPQPAVSAAARQTDNPRARSMPSASLGYATPIGARPTGATRRDRDADGIDNKLDECPETRAYTTVASNGCGLLDGILHGVEFKSGSYWLSPSSQSELDILAATLLAFPEVRVQVRAYTDSKGDEDLNLAVSRKRADIVVDYLLKQGVSALQLSPQGLGEADPIADNDTTLGRAQNRRIELLTLPNLTVEALASAAAATAGGTAPTVAKSTVDALERNESRVPRARRASPAADRALVFPSLAAQRIEPLPGAAYSGGFASAGVIEGLQFDSGSADLSTKGKRLLDRLAGELNEHPRVRVAVMAHTDDKGEEASNQRLSEKRAKSVVDYLVSRGVAPERLKAEGYGSQLPLVQNVSDADRARNRRVEIRLLP